MRRRTYFDSHSGGGWPDPLWLKPYFLAAPDERWTFDTGNDSWGLTAEGVDGTEHLEPGKGRIDLHLSMLGDIHHGVMLNYLKLGGIDGKSYFSIGDINRLYEKVVTLHGDPMPIGLYIPFGKAWAAVKEFIERDGALPQSIVWIASKDLPGDVFPSQ